MENLISIIIPVYNAEKYLKQCLTSISSQTYTNWELLLVVDGATDNSIEICKDFMIANPDKTIKVYFKKNGGVSSARNIGLSMAKGEYISFIDADDYLEKNYLEVLLKNMQKTNADLSICSAYMFAKRNHKVKKQKNITLEVHSTHDAIKHTIASRVYGGYLWQKLFKKSLLKGITFREDLYYAEDMVFSCDYLDRVNTVCFTNAKLYHYIKNTNSIVQSKFNERKLSIIKSFGSLKERYKADEELYAYASAAFFLVNLEIYYYLIRDKVKNKELKNELRKNIFENKKYMKKCKEFTFAKRKLCPFVSGLTKIIK